MNRSFTLLLLFLLLPGVSAVALNEIAPGGTVFIGEEGLDITRSGLASGDQIAWWAPGSARSSAPADIITVPDPSSFYVAPSTFSGKEGPWYRYPEGGSVIQVKEPRLRITIYDETAGFDATGKWIPRGDVASFKIESNLYEAGRRGDGSGGPVDIIIQNPGGAEYSSVQGPSGSFSLEGVRTSSSLYSTGPVWSTGDEEAGTYRIHAKGALNRLGDNNPVVGAGVSEEISVLIQGSNPLIKSGKDTAIIAGEDESSFVAGSKELSPVTTVSTVPVVERTSLGTPIPTTPSPAATTVIETPATPVTTAPTSPVTPVQTRETPLYAFIPIAALVVLLGLRRV